MLIFKKKKPANKSPEIQVNAALPPDLIQQNQRLLRYIHSFYTIFYPRFDALILVDLFAGEDTFTLESGTLQPKYYLQSIDEDLFSKYIFMEEDLERAHKLKIRINRDYPGKNILIMEGSLDDNIDRLKPYLPVSGNDFRAAALGVLNLDNLNISFEQISKLSGLNMNLLVSLRLTLDDVNTPNYYCHENPGLLENFLGRSIDENEISKHCASNEIFYRFLVKELNNNLDQLGYKVSGHFFPWHSTLMEVPVCFCGFYSKTGAVKKLSNKVEGRTHIQLQMFS